MRSAQRYTVPHTNVIPHHPLLEEAYPLNSSPLHREPIWTWQTSCNYV